MYAGTDKLKRWLSEAGICEIEVRETRSEIRLVGHSGFGPATLRLCGLTPNSLYSTGQFVPLVLRLELGVPRGGTVEALAARFVDGAFSGGPVR